MSSLKSRAAQLPRITLHNLESGDFSSFWVLNMTNPRGNLNLTVADGMGNQVPVRVPIASIPVDLSNQATKKSLCVNPQVRTLIAKGVLALIEPTAAMEFLKDPEAREENKRLYSLGEIAEIGDTGGELNEVQALVAETDGDINPFVLQLVAQTDMDEDETLRELKSREDEMSKDDFQYIAQGSRHEKVKAWAASKAI